MPLLSLVDWYRSVGKYLGRFGQNSLITNFEPFFGKVNLWDFLQGLRLGPFNEDKPVLLCCKLCLFDELELELFVKLVRKLIFFAVLSNKSIDLNIVESLFVFGPSIVGVYEELKEL